MIALEFKEPVEVSTAKGDGYIWYMMDYGPQSDTLYTVIIKESGECWHFVFLLRCMPSAFDYSLDYANLNLRQNPHLYRMGKGEQGVLLVEPYKSEILPLWRFRTPAIARKSANEIYQLFLSYRDAGDFAGMDMARKFVQMGFTRSRRYANHKSGKKYAGQVPIDKKGRSGAHGRKVLPVVPDGEKAKSASIFLAVLQKIKKDTVYLAAIENHKHLHS